MTINEKLEKLADDEGETTITPEGRDEQALKVIQAEVRRLRALADEGIIEIIGQPHQESRTGKRYIDRVRVRLTASGDELARGNPQMSSRYRLIESPKGNGKVFRGEHFLTNSGYSLAVRREYLPAGDELVEGHLETDAF